MKVFFCANDSADRLKQYQYLRNHNYCNSLPQNIIIILLCCRLDFRIERISFKFLITPHKSASDEMRYSLPAIESW